MLIGLPPSEFEHAVAPGRTRLYLLAAGDATRVVEVSDVGEPGMADLDRVVRTFRFG